MTRSTRHPRTPEVFIYPSSGHLHAPRFIFFRGFDRTLPAPRQSGESGVSVFWDKSE